MNAQTNLGFATRAIHHGYDAYTGLGSLIPPVYQSSTFTFPTCEEGGQRFAGEAVGYIYSRIGNPTTSLLESRLAELEGAEACVVTSSGQAATTTLLYTILEPGDELIADLTLYGCTFALFGHGMRKMGVKVKFVDLNDAVALQAAITPQTRVIFFETPANPNLRLVDIDVVSEMAKRRGVLTVVDNTYATPYLQRPIELGADFVVHSATKYLGGHGDLMAGAILGSTEWMERVRFEGLKDLTGAVLSAQDAQLVLRGLKTLSLRMERHCQSAQAVAEFLAAHPKVKSVTYPGLDSHPQACIARKQMRLAGGMISVELEGGYQAGCRMLNQLEVFTRAVSLGDCESLAQHPASMTHSAYPPEERLAHGITDSMVRLSVGLEDVADLLADLEQALAG